MDMSESSNRFITGSITVPDGGINIAIQLDQGAKTPTKATSGAAGYDLHASQDGNILSGSTVIVPTGIRIALPEGYYGRIAARSGLAIKNGLMVNAGVIDSDYRGPIGIVLFNSGGNFHYKKGDRMAQLIIEKHYSVVFNAVESLEESVRGIDGFGSSGV
jgi:dUTP pyrophosphatase